MNPILSLRRSLPAFCLLAFQAPLALHAADQEIWLDEFDVRHFTSGWASARKNQSISEQPLSIDGKKFERGAGVHAPSQGFFLLEEGSKVRFQASVGADDAPGGQPSVNFLVIGDGKTLYDSGTLGKGDRAKRIDVDLSDRKIVELRVTDGGDGNDSDHANWADARFVYSGKAPVMASQWAMTLPHYQGDPAKLAMARPARVITSPNGSVKAGIAVSDGRLVIKVLRDGKVSLETSPLGVTIDGVDYGQGVTIGSAEAYSTDETYAWIGNSSSLHDHSKGEKIQVTTAGQSRSWTLDVRAYNDGVAWRYVIPGSGRRTVEGEATSFVLPEGSVYWSHHNTANYEANYLRFGAEGDNVPTRPLTMPLTVELPDGGYACLTEATMIENDYSGMTLGPRGRILNGIFEDDPSWKLHGEITTPWRIVIAAKDLNTLVNQSIVYNVAPPPDPKLFPAGVKTEWVKPGRSFWTWGFGQWDTAKWESIHGFVDDAARLNCEYYVIDDPWREKKMGWHRNGRDEWASLKEVCEYAASKNVRIMVWEHWERLRDEKVREDFFKKVASAGAVGVKIDFMDNESQDRLRFFKSCLELGARHKILINFHGANKPAGEERTWPHWMTREAIYGMEQGGNIARDHLAALPFTRLVTGPGDFTPMVFNPGPMGRTTAGSQMATAVAYNSPLHHWADSADSYFRQPEEVVEFIRTKPVVWDETLVLPGSKIGETAAIARRAGEEWWISVINGTDDQKDYELVLDFIPAGEWKAVSYEDGSEKTKLKITKPRVESGQKIRASMAPGGGYVLILRKP